MAKTEEEVLQELSKQLEINPEELKAELEKLAVEVKQDPKFTGLTDEQARIFARNKLVVRKRRELLSPAIPWEGIVLGVGDLTDAVSSLKKATEDAFKADPERTTKGWVFAGKDVLADKTGKPLYPKTQANEKWRRVGKALPEHSWLRNIVGIFVPFDKKTKKASGDAKDASLTLNQAKAVNVKEVPIMKSIRVKAINKTTEDDARNGKYRLTSSAFTTFEPSTEPIANLEKILENSPHYQLLGELEEFWQKNQRDGRLDPDKWVITQGSVSSPPIERNEKTGNYRMVLDDESLLYAPPKESGFAGVTCWVPSDRSIDRDFGQDSRVYVVGRLVRGKAIDQLTRQPIEGGVGDLMINVWGIYCPEMFKVKAEVKALTNASLEPEPESSEEGEEW
jgi:hypothetical protein